MSDTFLAQKADPLMRNVPLEDRFGILNIATGKTIDEND